ncbi:hypothetical protein [Niallia sp. NCCP-28]|uniref:hypothetical protein n=1 Tax=Niallia sp. NCCP-28 TaxID=2934712 RepID=UPI002088F25B|nr:hypothetical protein [Niallia sp. NCCP-28]GKU82309.1 hypothetical protein NCCP28_17050 [Niallia sp. NCCP-28]
MTGTAILFHEDSSVTFLENIDITDFQLLQTAKSKQTIFLHATKFSYFCENEIDWDYGY